MAVTMYTVAIASASSVRLPTFGMTIIRDGTGRRPSETLGCRARLHLGRRSVNLKSHPSICCLPVDVQERRHLVGLDRLRDQEMNWRNGCCPHRSRCSGDQCRRFSPPRWDFRSTTLRPKRQDCVGLTHRDSSPSGAARLSLAGLRRRVHRAAGRWDPKIVLPAAGRPERPNHRAPPVDIPHTPGADSRRRRVRKSPQETWPASGSTTACVAAGRRKVNSIVPWRSPWVAPFTPALAREPLGKQCNRPEVPG